MRCFTFLFSLVVFFSSHARNNEVFLDYVDSLSKEELVILHNLHEQLEEDVVAISRILKMASSAVFLGGASVGLKYGLASKASVEMGPESRRIHVPIRFLAAAGSAVLIAIGTFFAGSALLEGEAEGLGLDSSDTSSKTEEEIRQQVLDHFYGLNIEEAKDFVQLFSEARKDLENEIYSQQ